jgi:DNA repair protein RadD
LDRFGHSPRVTDPRDIYQSKMESDVYSAWDNGARNVLAVLPTGGGKSVVIRRIVTRKNALGAMQCVIAHRTELVSQLAMHVAECGIKHRIIAPREIVADITAEQRALFGGRSFVNPDAICTVAAVDTLLARQEQLAPWAKQVDDWTIDEAHHVLRLNKWGRAVEMFPNATGLGVTASPDRADGMGLGRYHDGLFDHMVIGPDMRQLIDMGALSDYELVCPESDLVVDDDDFNKEGELSPKKGRLASKKSHIVGDIVQRYVQFAFGKRAIVFVTDVETANEVAANFNAVGIAAAAVNGETHKTTRREMIKRFRDGRLTVLINVDLFGEGFDVPACEVVIMARPTGSLAVYLQQFGRALRILAGKRFGMIIDMVSNYKRHGFPDKPHYWTLDRRDKKAKKEKDPEEIPLTSCKSCSRPFERFHTACPYCGAPVEPPAGVIRTLDVVDGDLVLLDTATLAAMRAATVLDSPAAVGAAAAHVAGPMAGKGAVNRSIERHAAQQRLSAAFAQYAGCQRAKGRDDRSTHKRIYLTLGVDVLTALALPRADMEAIANKVEGWCVP